MVDDSLGLTMNWGDFKDKLYSFSDLVKEGKYSHQVLENRIELVTSELESYLEDSISNAIELHKIVISNDTFKLKLYQEKFKET